MLFIISLEETPSVEMVSMIRENIQLVTTELSTLKVNLQDLSSWASYFKSFGVGLSLDWKEELKICLASFSNPSTGSPSDSSSPSVKSLSSSFKYGDGYPKNSVSLKA